MKIRLLNKGYKNNEQFYLDFLEGRLDEKEEYFSDEVVELTEAPDFPIYLSETDESKRELLYFEALKVMTSTYLKTERDIHLEEVFWHSLLCTHKRDYILTNYPQVTESFSAFKNVVLKKFDWENYIYKCVLGAQYVLDHTDKVEEQERYYRLIAQNLDMYNYMLKYQVFRSKEFIINVLDIIDEHDISEQLKQKLRNRPDLGADERVGRRVLFEFNKSYPVILFPMLSKEELEPLFFEYLWMYI